MPEIYDTFSSIQNEQLLILFRIQKSFITTSKVHLLQGNSGTTEFTSNGFYSSNISHYRPPKFNLFNSAAIVNRSHTAPWGALAHSKGATD